MSRTLHIAAWSVFLLLNGWFLFESFGYFRQNPADLIYVGGITLAGGVGTGFYFSLGFSWRKRLRLVMYALATSSSALCGVWMAFMLWKIWRMLPPIPPVLTASEKSLVLQGAAVLFVLIPILVLICGVTAFRCWKKLLLMLKDEGALLSQ